MTGFAVQTGLFFQRKLRETLRQPVWIITGLTTPVLYLALFAPLLRSLGGGPGFPPGTCSTYSCQGSWCLSRSGRAWAGWPIIWELDSGVIERLRVTPASRLALLLGTVLRDVVMFAVPGAVVIAVGAAFRYHGTGAASSCCSVQLALLTASARRPRRRLD